MRSEDSGDGRDGKAAKTSCLRTSANWMWEAKADLEDVPLSKVTSCSQIGPLGRFLDIR